MSRKRGETKRIDIPALARQVEEMLSERPVHHLTINELIWLASAASRLADAVLAAEGER